MKAMLRRNKDILSLLSVLECIVFGFLQIFT